MVLVYGFGAIVAAALHVALFWSHGPLLAVVTAPLSASAVALVGAVAVAVRPRKIETPAPEKSEDSVAQSARVA